MSRGHQTALGRTVGDVAGSTRWPEDWPSIRSRLHSRVSITIRACFGRRGPGSFSRPCGVGAGVTFGTVAEPAAGTHSEGRLIAVAEECGDLCRRGERVCASSSPARAGTDRRRVAGRRFSRSASLKVRRPGPGGHDLEQTEDAQVTRISNRQQRQRSLPTSIAALTTSWIKRPQP